MFRAGDISICLEPTQETGRTDVSIESADILRIPLAFRICRYTERMLLICSSVLAVLKLILAVLGSAGLLSVTAVAGIDFAFSAAAVIYSLTSFTLEKRG